MTAPGRGPQQSRLLPYLVIVLVILLGYVTYTRLSARPRPQALPPLSPPPAATSPAPAVTPAAQPTPSPAPTPIRVALPARPVGRPNPFNPLIVPQAPAPAPRTAARPAPPPLPPVPPPFFPGEGARPGQMPLPGPTPTPQPQVPFRVTGTVIQGGVRMAVLQAGQRIYFARVGDVIEGFRIVAVEPEFVRVQRGTFEHVFHLREVEAQ
ncbi:MAG: hypothetical protein QN172_08510 [Armatimonadota bacterium]|nr:hypothetical protein [Armatimonadota bacterium]MDR7440201.1 hypothetical protein [Armatimonadota bacterium]MDR7562598.1 hypothetical protein [Armatimonadota bacterium]MDR7567841.1 hypothetical protein [Armatimonadota bacterium]MDR7602484.1 hypothetical protein [Armatimonadota bacterium]